MIKVKEFIQRVKTFINENPQRKKLFLIIFVLAIIPLTVIAALTVQNLRQYAGGGTTVRISDQNGNTIFQTSNPNVFIDMNLNATANWVLPGQPSAFNTKNNIVKNAYASSASCSPPYSGFSGCFDIETAAPPANYYCAGSCTTDFGQAGQYCYTSTKVGQVCTTDSNLPGTCNNQGDCIASVLPTPTPAPPTPTSAPTLIPIATSMPTEIISPSLIPTSPPPSQTVVTPTPTPIPPTPTPIPNILRAVYIENKDTDGSTGGSAPIKITVNNSADITHIIWRLNDLLPGQTQAPQTIQVTLIGDNLAVPFANTINLIRPTSPTNILSNVNLSLFDCSKQMQIGQECHMSALAYDTANSPTYKDVDYTWGISSSLSSIGTLNKTNGNITSFYAQNVGTGSIWVLAQQGNTQVQKSIIIQVGTAAKSATLKQFPSPEINTAPTINADLNRDGVVNCKDTKILISQFGQKGANLSVDLNRDGIVDGIDYNTIIRNYTPGDTTVCFQ